MIMIKKTMKASSKSTDSDSVSDESDQEYDLNPETALPSVTEASSSKKAKLACQVFFSSLEEDFSRPAASYPLQKYTIKYLPVLFGKSVRPLVVSSFTMERE